MSPMLDAERLRAFMDDFYGYGTWNARLWFVGMEEGGGETLEEIERRLNAWSGAELEDLRGFHLLAGFADRTSIQSTWGKLIRIALCADGRTAHTEDVRQYQRDELARSDGNTALIELFPLPSPSTRHWTYEDSGVPEIATRDQYRELLAKPRIEAIRSRIATYRPPTVVFYGTTYRKYWAEIAGVSFERVAGAPFEIAEPGSTLFILAPHPVARGVKSADFCRIGERIRETNRAAKR